MINTTATIGTDFKTRKAMLTELATSNVAVIFLGANDFNDNYAAVFNNTEAPDFLSGILTRLAAIHDYLRAKKPAIPIVICTVADIGATPRNTASYPDPVKRLSTRAKIAAFNQSLMTMAQGRGAAVARIDHLTDRAYDEVPFNLNGTVFHAGGRDGEPCRACLHPGQLPPRDGGAGAHRE